MERIWFRKTADGLWWKPISWQGWTLSGLWILGNMWYLLHADNQSYSIRETLLKWGLFFIVSTFVLLIIVRYRSDRNWI